MTASASDFNDEWGRVKKKCKGLSRFSSALSRRFEDRLREILRNLEKCIIIKEREEGQEEVISRLRTFAAVIRGDIEGIKAARRLTKRMEEAEKEFQRLRAELREYEAKAYDACGKYFERRQEYVRAREKTMERLQRSLDDLRKGFLEKAEEIAEGYEVVYSGMPTTPEDLFEELMKGEEGKLELKPKRILLGVSGEEALAKREVLDYLIKETRSRLTPVLREKEDSVRETEAMFPELRALEKECAEAEKLREEAMRPLEELRREIVNIRRSGAFAYTAKEKPQEIFDSYRERIEEIDNLIY